MDNRSLPISFELLQGLGSLAPQQPQRVGSNTSGRPMYRDQGGGVYSEKTATFPMFGSWMTYPTVDGSGTIHNEDWARNQVMANGAVDPITGEQFPTFKTQDEAERYARMRSRTR